MIKVVSKSSRIEGSIYSFIDVMLVGEEELKPLQAIEALSELSKRISNCDDISYSSKVTNQVDDNVMKVQFKLMEKVKAQIPAPKPVSLLNLLENYRDKEWEA